MFSFGRKTLLAVVAVLMFFGLTINAEAKEIRVGYLVADQLHFPAIMVMKERNMLEKEGYTVKWSEFLAGSYVMQEMASGSLDFVSCGAVPISISHAQGVKINILASGNQEGSALVVGRDVNSIKDLEGKKIGTPGTGSIQDAMVAQLLKDNNVNARRMSMKVSDMPLFLDKGEISAFVAWQPHCARAVANNFGKILYTSHEMMPGHQCCVLAALQSTVKKDPELVKTFMKVYLEAYKWYLENPDESCKMVMKATGMTEDVVRTAMKGVLYPPVPYVNDKSIAYMVEGLIATKKITAIKKEQIADFVNDLYNPSFLEALTTTK